MDTKVEIKQEDCFVDDLASQNEGELFHKVITVKSNSNAVLSDDNGCDMDIKTEIKSEGVTCRNNCELFIETKIDKQALDSDFVTQKPTEFLSEDPLMKTKNYNSDQEMDNNIEIKVEPWWLETETSSVCDDVKDEGVPPETSSRLSTEAVSGVVSDKSPLTPAEVLGRDTNFCNQKDPLECEHQKSDIEMSTADEYALSEQYSKCSEEGEICQTSLLFNQKTLIHDGKTPHKCETCDKSFTRLSYLKMHKLTHEGKKPYKCNICDKSYTHSSHLKRHYLIHEGKKPHQCKLCNKSFTHLTSLKTHSFIHEDKKPHQCRTCDKSYTRLSNLNKHNLVHEGKKPHKCNMCDKSFTYLSSLKTHNLIHDDKKQHHCKLCDKSFTHLSNFISHNLIHEGKKPYQCTICDKSFTQLSNLKTHNLIHEGKKPHQCNACEKSFTQLSHLKRHYLTHKDK